MLKSKVMPLNKRYSTYLPELENDSKLTSSCKLRSKIIDASHLTLMNNPIFEAMRIANNKVNSVSIFDIMDVAKLEENMFLNPDSKLLRHWDTIISVLLFFIAIVTPFEIGFLEPKLNFLFILNRLIDTVFFIDVIVNFKRVYFSYSLNCWVKDKRMIKLNYLKGWFCLDFIAILPFDLLTLVYDQAESLYMFRVIRILRFIKLLRILKSSRIFSRMQEILSLTYATTSLIKFIGIVILIIHWIACIWNICETLEDNEMNWKSDNSFFSETDIYATYLGCVEVSIMFMVMSYGRFYPKNTTESLVAIVSMLIAGSVYAYVIGSICSVVSTQDPATQDFHNTMDLLNRYMRENNFSKQMRIELRRYFIHCKDVLRMKYYGTLLQSMSPVLRGKVADCLHRQWIDKIPFFNAPSACEKYTFTTALAMSLQPYVFVPSEPVYSYGEEADSMYIVQKGVAAGGGRLYCNGSFFGEEMICSHVKRKVEVKALTYLDVYVLEYTPLQALLCQGQFRTTRMLIRKASIRILLWHKIKEIVRMNRVITPNYRRMSEKVFQEEKKRLMKISKKMASHSKKKKKMSDTLLDKKDIDDEVFNKYKNMLKFWTDENTTDESIIVQNHNKNAEDKIVMNLTAVEQLLMDIKKVLAKKRSNADNAAEEIKEIESPQLKSPKVGHLKKNAKVILKPLK